MRWPSIMVQNDSDDPEELELEAHHILLNDKWRQLFDKYDPEGFGEIPWDDFLLALESQEFQEQVDPARREALGAKAQEHKTSAITFEDFVSVISPALLSVDHSLNPADVSTAVLTYSLSWTNVWNHVATKQQGIKPQMSCVSGLQLAAARLARKQQNYKLAQDLLLKSIKLITGTESDVLNGPGGNKSLLQVLKNLCNFPVSEQLLEVQREGAKLLQSGGNSEDGIGILLGSTRSSVTILNNKELVLKDTSLSFLRELTTRSILTLVKYLRQDAALLTQLSSCQNENLEKDVENFNWLLETSAQSPSTVSCLTDSLRRSLSDFSGLHFQADYTVGPTDCALGQLLHLGVNQCPMSAKAWSLLAGWCYRWGRKAVDTSSSTNSLYPEEAEKALSILPQDIDSETKEAVLQVLRQIHRSTCEDWDDDHPGWDLLEDMAEMTKKQLTSICPQLTSSKIFLEHLVAIRKGVVQRAYCYYELTAKAYFQFLHLSDQSNLEKENVTATLRLLRLVVKHASELRDVLEKGLAKTPTAPWRGIIPQLFSRLSHPEPYVRQSISDLLCRVAQASPHLIVFPAVVGCLTSKARVNLQQDTSCDFFEPYLSQGLAAETGSHDLVTLPDNQDLPKSIPGVVSDEEDSEEDSQNTAIMQNCFSALVETLGRQDARTIAEVKTLVHELRRITLLWDELWLGTLTLHHSEMCRRVSILEEEIKKVEGNSSLSKQDKLQIIKEKHHVFLKTVLFVLQQLQQITSQPPETPHEQWFQNTFNEVIETTLEKLQNPSNPYQPHQSLQYYKQLHQMLQQKVQQQSRGHLMMDKISPVLADLKSTVIPMPGINATSSSIVTIQSFFQNVSILPTKTKPKKLAFVGSDGQKYTYLFKGLEDLHLDERIMQFLSIVNNMFMKKKRNGNVIYKARHYSVTPLGPRSGLIQWVDGATALFGLYKRWQQREAVAQVLKNQAAGVSIVPSTILRPSEVFYNKLNPILKEKGISVDSRKEWPLSILLHVLKDLMCETPRDLLTKELWCSCSSALEWWEVTQTYSHSTAVMSMIGYIIGLGDRHLDNVLVDLATGEVVHIDYNVCFEKGKNLRVPEKVPFRMTPNIETALGITGVEGTFRASCEYVLNVLRKERETLLTLLEAFVYDPLIDWTPGNEGGYTGAVYGGGQSVVTDTRQTKQEMEREIAFSMFAIRVAEMKGDWLKNKDDLAASLPKLNKFLLAWLEAQTELQAAETELQETCHKRALLEEARIDSSHSLHSLPKRYEEYAVVKNTVQSAKDAVQDKLDDCKKWHNHHISGLQSLCGPELGQWYIEIAKLEPQTESVPEVHVAGFLQSAGQGQLVQQCEHAEFELNNLLEQQRLTLGTCLELLSRYATIIMQFSPSYKKENRNFQWQEWLESLLNTFTLSNCQVVINKFHNKYGAESIDVELVQAAVTTYVQMQSEVTNLKTKVVNLLERRHLEGVEDLPSITAAVKDAKAHLAQFIEENGEEGQFSLMGVMVKALSALTKRLVMMEGAAAAAGEHLVDLVSWGGDWFLDEIHSVGNNVAQVISVLQENCKNIQPQVKAAFSTVTSALNVFTALEDLSFNFQTIILPEAMKCIQSKEPSVLEMVEKLEMLLKGPSLTVTELTVKLESHLRNLIMEIEDDQSSVVTTVNLMRRNFDNLMRGAEPEISELTPGQMLLMGFSGLFSKLEADMADFLLSLDQLAPSPSWRKLDVMRDAATLTPPVYSASTRSVLNHIFFLRRLQTMQEFFQQCHQNAASLQLSDRRVGLRLLSEDHIYQPIKQFIADYMIRQVLGLPSQAVTFALCSLMGSLGVDVTAEIEQKDIGAESKVSLDDLSNKVVDRYVKDKFPSGQLSQTSSLTSALDTVWRKWDLARRLEKHDVLLKESVQRVQLQLARYHWLFEDILAQGNVGPLQNLTAYGRSTLMSEMRKAVQTLLSLESAVSQSQDRYLSVTASVEQRLKWAAGANPSLASTQEEFEAGITEKTATTSATAQLSRELMNVCNAILHFEAMRTRTSEALASDSSFLNLINRSQESCLLAANCVSQVTKLEEHLIDLQPLPETGGITSDWITSILEKISQSLAKSKEKLEQKEVESFSHWDVVKNHVILIRSLLTTHYNLMTDVRSILKSLAKHEEVALKEEDQQIVPVQQYLLKYRSFSEQISAMVREVLSDVCEHDPHKVNKIREKLAPLPSLTVDVYDGLIELAGPVGSHSHPVFTCIISDATAGKNPNYQKVRGERTVVGKKMLPPSVRDGDLYSEPSPGSQGAGSRPLSTPIPDKNKKSNVFRDPKTGKVVQERNSYATNVWRRVKVKLDGKDPDLNRRLSVAEQVDFVIKEATNMENLAVLYEGWTPWV